MKLIVFLMVFIIVGCSGGEPVKGTNLIKYYDAHHNVVCYRTVDTSGLSCIKLGD